MEASEPRPALHTPANPPQAPSGAARAARPRAIRYHLVDVALPKGDSFSKPYEQGYS